MIIRGFAYYPKSLKNRQTGHKTQHCEYRTKRVLLEIYDEILHRVKGSVALTPPPAMFNSTGR